MILHFDICISNCIIVSRKQSFLEKHQSFLNLIDWDLIEASSMPSKCINLTLDWLPRKYSLLLFDIILFNYILLVFRSFWHKVHKILFKWLIISHVCYFLFWGSNSIIYVATDARIWPPKIIWMELWLIRFVLIARFYLSYYIIKSFSIMMNLLINPHNLFIENTNLLFKCFYFHHLILHLSFVFHLNSAGQSLALSDRSLRC